LKSKTKNAPRFNPFVDFCQPLRKTPFSAKSGKKKKNKKTVESGVKRELVLRENNQEQYGQITRNLGDGRMMVWCFPHVPKKQKKLETEEKLGGKKLEIATTEEKLGADTEEEETFEEKKGAQRLGIIRGKMKKRVWMVVGDFVLVSLRGFQDEKCDIVHKYDIAEVRKLMVSGELPDGGDFFLSFFDYFSFLLFFSPVNVDGDGAVTMQPDSNGVGQHDFEFEEI
jgi:translation initiation factor 1A